MMESTLAHTKPEASSDVILEIETEPPSLLNPQPIIQVFVSKEQAEFFVHKNYLCYYSPYFAAALQDGVFVESHTQTVELDHANIEAFGLFVNWLYKQSLPIVHGSSENSAADKPSWSGLVYLWILADYLQIPALQNLVIDEMLSKFSRLCEQIPVELYSEIYNNTSSESALRKLLVDRCVWKGYADSDIYLNRAIPRDMLNNISRGLNFRLFSPGVGTKSPLEDSSNYHVKISKSK